VDISATYPFELVGDRAATPRPTTATEPLAVAATWAYARLHGPERYSFAVLMAVAALGLIGLLLVNHGPWTKPKVQNEAMIQHGTTAGSAAAVGATVTPTDAVPGPKPVAPAIPN